MSHKGLKAVTGACVDVSIFPELAEEGPVVLAPEDISSDLDRPVVVDLVVDIGAKVKLPVRRGVIAEEG